MASVGVHVANCFCRENELKGACSVCRGFPKQQTSWADSAATKAAHVLGLLTAALGSPRQHTSWADSLLLQKTAHVLGTLTAAPAF